MAYPAKLPSLTDREAIADCILRACIGIDINDEALFLSGWATDDDVCFSMNGANMSGRAEILKVFNNVGPMDTSHHVSNIRVNLQEGATAATATAYGLHQHFRASEGTKPGAPFLMVGGRYDVDVIKDEKEGLWRLRRWGFRIVWKEGDASVMGG